jgi:hypothetical protein
MAKGASKSAVGVTGRSGGSPVNTDDPSLRLSQAERRVLEIQTKLHRWARDDNRKPQRDLWSARCLEKGTPGAGSGPGKRPGTNRDRAPGRLHRSPARLGRGDRRDALLAAAHRGLVWLTSGRSARRLVAAGVCVLGGGWYAGGHGVRCPGPPALPSIQAGLVAQQPSCELVEGAGIAHAQKRVRPKGVASFAPGRGCVPTVFMRPSCSPPGRDGADRRRCRRPTRRGR